MACRKLALQPSQYSINYNQDVVSLLLYTWDEEYKDMSLIFYLENDEKHIHLPFRKAFCTKNEMIKPLDFENSKNLKKGPSKTSKYSKDKSKEVEASQWKTIAKEILKELFDESVIFGKEQLLYQLRVYSPIQMQYFYHVIFGMHVDVKCLDDLHNKDIGYIFLARKQIYTEDYCIDRKQTLWIIENLYNQLFLLQKQTSSDSDITNTFVDTFSHGAVFEEINPQQFVIEKSSKDSTSMLTLLDSPGYTMQDKERLYEQFINLSFPHSTVTFNCMKPLLTKLGFVGTENKAFRALDEHRRGELDLLQFMLGLTAVDPLTQHGAVSGELRCRHIFRFYDKSKSGFLDPTDLTDMIKDILRIQNQATSEIVLDINLQKAYQTFGVPPSENVPLPKFLASVGNLKFRGTSVLFRSLSTVPGTIKRIRDPWCNVDLPSSFTKRNKSSELHLSKLLPTVVNRQKRRFNDDSSYKSSFGYMLAEHTVTIKRSGTVANVSNLVDMERAGEVSNTGLDSDSNWDMEESLSGSASQLTSSELAEQIGKRRVEKQFSAEAFNLKSLPNEMIIALRYFEMKNDHKDAFNWGVIDKIRLSKYINTLCDSVKEIFESEPRLLHIPAPCYVLGDLHGNFHDLICFEKALWRLGPHLTPINFLFLGDYVDRGEFGLEVVMYLFAQKLRAPNRFNLLRGNHEERNVQQSFTFHKECLEKFGESLGEEVWENINQAFDRMPLAAVVDKKIFCIHGGIPQMEGTIEQIDSVPNVLPEPHNTIAWQLMWNDPVSAEDLTEETKLELKRTGGFAHNTKRRTAFVFDEKAFEMFLDRNDLSHVIRAHEVKQAGFEIQESGRLFTVFSSSHYSGNNNKAACILVNDYRIRAIRIDTSY